jgi:hypothetical protein
MREIMCIYNTIKDIITIIISVITLIVLVKGLQTWKIQIKGEDTFKLSLDILRELKLILYSIDTYRNHHLYTADELKESFEKHENKKIEFDSSEDMRIASRYLEMDELNNIIEKYSSYDDKMLKLMIILNDYRFDVIKNKRFRDYIYEMKNCWIKIDLNNDELRRYTNMPTEEKEKTINQNRKWNKVLKNVGEIDEWRNKIEEYFNEINKKLRQYIK